MGFGLTTTSCNKDDDNSEPKTVTELLTDHCWKLTTTIDAYDEDNIEYFNTDGTYLGDVGTDLCDPTEEDATGTWELSADETTLSLTVGSGGLSITIDFVIDAISENSMTLSIPGLVSGTYVRC